MSFIRIQFLIVLIILVCVGCSKNKKLEVVTYDQFKQFVAETGYVTDAEKFGWSFVQLDVYNFIKVKGANWKKPDSRNKPKSADLPVTQVSYNDAIAYCKWSGSRLPTYDEYWLLIKNDKRKIIADNNGAISAVKEVNILGNVWDITSTKNNGNIRLAGGSLFCSPTTCHGTKKERELFVDKQTANLHIGFAVLR